MKKKLLILISIFLGTFLLLYVLSRFEFSFENQTQDLFVKYFAKNTQSKNIELIVIDDISVDRVRYPWPRKMYSDIFRYLQDFGKTKIIVFDAVVGSYDDYNRKSDETLFKTLPDINTLVAGYTLYENEKRIKGSSFSRDRLFDKKAGLNIKDLRTVKPPNNNGFSNFPSEYLRNIKYLGHVHNIPDKDGTLRTATPVMNYKGKLYPSLALKTYSILTGLNSYTVTDNYLFSNDSKNSLKVPITVLRGGFGGVYSLVNWYKIKYSDENAAYSYHYTSAIDIIDSYAQIMNGEKPKIAPERFKDKIVFVGGCANNELIRDKKITPMSARQAGVDYQATVLDNLLSGKFMKKLNPMHNLLIIFAMGLISLAVIRKSSIRIALIVTGILLTLYYISAVILINQRIIILLLSPIIFEVYVFAAGYAYQFFIEGIKKQKLQHAMGQYISKDIMKTVVKNIDKIAVGGKRADVTVMFVDIRGFTTISEKLPPEKVTELLNEYISAVEPIIGQYKGVLNKFIGDAIMAIFGEPIPEKNHAENAVRCANQVLKKIQALQQKWLIEGKPKIEIGVGLCSGEVFVGNIGSQERLEYTVIGDVVNIASRIEALNKVFKTKFLISEETYTRVRDIADVIMIRDVAIRGKMQKINIYEVLRITQ